MSEAVKIRKITPEKKAKLGGDKFYNVEKDTWMANSERAIEVGKKKGLHYDTEYGLVASDPANITAFIQLNELEPISGGAAVTPAAGKPAAAKSPKLVKAPTSAAFRDRVSKSLATLEAGKYLNLSSMRPVKEGKKELVYNKSFALAAKVEDKQLLDETVVALGGSPSGPLSTTGSLASPQPSSEVRAPDPSSTRVGKKQMLDKFGTVATSITPVVAVAVTAAAVIVDPVPVKREAIVIKPTPAALSKPAVAGLPFASKQTMLSAMPMAKPLLGKASK